MAMSSPSNLTQLSSMDHMRSILTNAYVPIISLCSGGLERPSPHQNASSLLPVEGSQIRSLASRYTFLQALSKARSVLDIPDGTKNFGMDMVSRDWDRTRMRARRSPNVLLAGRLSREGIGLESAHEKSRCSQPACWRALFCSGTKVRI